MLSSSVRSSSASAASASRSFTRVPSCSPSSFASTSRVQLPSVPSVRARCVSTGSSRGRDLCRSKQASSPTALPSRRQLSRSSSASQAQPDSSPHGSPSSATATDVVSDSLYLDGITERPPPLITLPTDPTSAFIRQRITQIERELAAPVEGDGASSSPSGTAPYTAKQAASSLSELGTRLDALIETTGGDLVQAQEQLERLAFELGREKDLTSNTLPNGKRKPSFAPNQELTRTDVQTVMEAWELSLERAIITALHPRSKRLEDRTREYLTYSQLLGTDFVFNPRRVAQLVTRTLMTLIVSKTAPSADNYLKRAPGEYVDDATRAKQAKAQLENYLRVHQVGLARDSARNADDTGYLHGEQIRSAEAWFDIPTREAVDSLATQFELEYYYAVGVMELKADAGVIPSKQMRQAVINKAQQKLDERSEIEKNATCVDEHALNWSEVDRYRLGADLLSIAIDVWSMRTVGLPGKPALRMHKAYNPGLSYHVPMVIRPHVSLVRMLLNAAPDVRFLARNLPMLVPPKLWPTAQNGLARSQRGGYLLDRKTGIVKKMSRKERRLPIERAMAAGEMDDLLEAVNTISTNPWRVNSKVLDVIIHAIHPDRNFFREAVKKKGKTLSTLDKAALLVKPHHLLPLNIARAYEGRDFYLPHNLDYRGRIYSLSPYLHPPGDDFSRGLLTFAKARPLGPDGLYWLKVHLSGVYGKDKESFDGRVAWVDSHLEEISASASDPTTEEFWLKGDKPFQILAACLEIDAALRSGDVEAYESSLPVHMDGTCNGMQYYAALGRDLKGGASVNLSPAEVPQDVYSEVLETVRNMINGQGRKERKWAALRAHGSVLLVRKTVKTTVMTSVYGVTNVGAIAQVKTALVEQNKQLPDDDKLTESKIDDLSKNLAEAIILSIDKLFPVATSIQHWFGACLDLIVNSRTAEADSGSDITAEHKHSMAWTTPLGLPVVQAYRELKVRSISTKLQSFSVVDHDKTAKIEPNREHNGFAPNFIHSLDASHLFMTVNDCTKKGVTFGSVHDSFWTHAATVPDLNASLRDAFVRLHSSEPSILDRLRGQLIGSFGRNVVDAEQLGRIKKAWADKLEKRREAEVEDDPDDPWVQWGAESRSEGPVMIQDVLPPAPLRGELDIEDVKKSKYFFK